MSEQKRIQKRFRRENRPDKGVNAEAKRRAHNARVRGARSRYGSLGGDDAMLLLPAYMFGGGRR